MPWDYAVKAEKPPPMLSPKHGQYNDRFAACWRKAMDEKEVCVAEFKTDDGSTVKRNGDCLGEQEDQQSEDAKSITSGPAEAREPVTVFASGKAQIDEVHSTISSNGRFGTGSNR
jgi:hypothetical protein